VPIQIGDWIEMNQRTLPVREDVTDEFLRFCERDPNNIVMRLARTSGLPEGVNPADARILKLFEVERNYEVT